MYLSVIIPAYNEEKRLPKTLLEIDRYLRKQDYEYEIIVVSDGSKDRTSEAVNNLKSEILNLKLIDNKENHGKGYVVRQGLIEAKGQYRLFTDADNSTSLDQVEDMIPYFNQDYDIVIGSRDVKGAVLDPPQPWHRVLVGNMFNLLTQFIVGLWGIWDTQCGFKALSAEAAEKILPKCRINRWAFDPEILKLGRKMGFKIKEVPVRWVNDPDSKVKLKGMIRMGFDLLKIRWNLITGKYSE
ncbi:MAG: glycosyltransferase family 2 protein [Candidatus Pacebacteria bacterium]|nr:glycosyltransferase family 2 protein [Candidatus Paceibacterota bacterium]